MNKVAKDSSAKGRQRSSLCLSDGRLRLVAGANAPAELLIAAMRFFDDDLIANEGMICDLPSFIDTARRIEPTFYYSNEAINFILEHRDRCRRKAMAEDVDFASILEQPLLPYQQQGARAAFESGKILIADQAGLDKTTQAIAVAQLMRKLHMLGSVLVICPTSLKYQWQKELVRLTDASVVVIEGNYVQRRPLYDADADFKIVSYHTLANDVKNLTNTEFEMVIMDQLQRLAQWNGQIAQATRRISADYCMGLADNLNIPADLRDVFDSTISRSINEVKDQMSPVRQATLFLPMTKEQQGVYSQAQSVVTMLTDKWLRYRFLSEKERRRLLYMLGRIRMACDSTFLLDQKSRFDTKVAEAVQIAASFCRGGNHKVAVISQWDRMLRLVTEELENAGIMPVADISTATVVINLDLPLNHHMLKRRLARCNRNNLLVINMVSAGTIEEKLLAASDADREVFDGSENSFTINDNKLDAIASVLSALIS